jgi:hypothetical protein
MTTRIGTGLVVAAAVAALAAAGCGSSGTGSGGTASAPPPSTASLSPSKAATPSSLAPTSGPYRPQIKPADFSSTIDNRNFPLQPGMTFHLAGTAENGTTPQTDISVVTNRIKPILGVPSRAVRDTVYSRGNPIERTYDYYAQDRQGNVWYMGEDARDVQNGRFVKASDSWQGGVGVAEPGIIMPADPASSGGSYRQEYLPGHAMDQARVIGPSGTITTPAGTFRHTFTTVETSPSLEPGLQEQKWYAAGVGEIKEAVVKGNHEHFTLTSHSG